MLCCCHALLPLHSLASFHPCLAALAAKVRCGQGRTREVLTPELAAAIQAKWGEACQPVTGYASFAEMRAGVNRELGRPFSSS